jgi:uncharacterized protein YdbL (DUF1318 family)
MRLRATLFTLSGLAALFVIACVTINVYFPEAAIKDISEQIEAEVAQKAAEAAAAAQAEGEADAGAGAAVVPPAADGEAVPNSAGLFDLLLGVTPAYADEVSSPEITNPAIRRIIDSRAARLPAIRKFKNKGVIGEGNDALLTPRDLQSITDLKQRAEVQRLIRDENMDREELFKEIAAAKKVDLSQLARIKETYAATLRNDAAAGDWIQLPNGQWQQK